MATTKALELAQLADGIDVNANGEITNIGTLSSLDISGDISTSTLAISGTTASSNTTTGSLVVAGGVGIGDDLFVNDRIQAGAINIGSGANVGTVSSVAIGLGDGDTGLYRQAFNRVDVAAGGKRVATFDQTYDFFLYNSDDTTAIQWDASEATLKVNENLTVSGNFTVSGNTTFVNTDNLEIEDLNITLASGAANSAVADGAGITIDGADATLTYDAGGDRWKLNRSLYTTAAGNNLLILESVSGGSGVHFNTGGGTLNSYIRGGVGGTANLRFQTNGDNDRLIIQDNGDIHFIETDTGDPGIVYDANVGPHGALLIGGLTSIRPGSVAGLNTAKLSLESNNFQNATFVENQNSAVGYTIALGKSRGTDAGDVDIVQAGDMIGQMVFAAADGTDLRSKIAGVSAYVSPGTTPAENSISGELRFETTNSAQNTTTRMVIDKDGNVGIGTQGGMVPDTPLTVVEYDTATSIIPQIKLAVNTGNNTPGATGSSIDFVASGDMAAVGARIIGSRAAAGAHMDLRFHTQRDQFAMIIDPSQRVGIRTDNPGAALHVYSNTTTEPAMIIRNDNASAGGRGLLIQHDNGGEATDRYALNIITSYGSGNKQSLFVGGSGNVGIGTDTPTVMFEVGKSVSGETGLAIFNSEGGNEVGLKVQSRTNRATLQVSDNDTSNFVQAEDGHAIYGQHSGLANADMTIDTAGNMNLLNGAYKTEQVRHSIRPTLNLDFANSKQLDPRITFYRDSIATYYDSKGIMRISQEHEPRFTHDENGECRGLLLEETRTNGALYSNDFETEAAGAWYHAGAYAQSRAAVGPDGKFTATKLIESNGSERHQLYRYHSNITEVVGDYTVSVFAKAGDRDYFCLAVETCGLKRMSIIADLVNGTITDDIVASAGGIMRDYGVETVGNGWHRIWMTFYNDSTSGNINTTVATSDSATPTYTSHIPDYQGDGRSGVYIAYLQLEEGSFMTSYMPEAFIYSTRTSTATYNDENGILQTAPINTVRYGHEYDGQKWVPTGAILERSRTNIAPNFNQSGWTFELSSQGQSRETWTRDTVAPDGSYTATKIDVSSASDDFTDLIFSTNQNFAGEIWTWSCWVKGTAGETLSVKLDGAGGPGSFSDVTLTGEWQRVSATYEYASSYSQLAVARVGRRGLSGSTTGTANVFYVWGAQLEEGTGMSSYIYTTGGGTQSVTRSSDSLTRYTGLRYFDRAISENVDEILPTLNDSEIQVTGYIELQGIGHNGGFQSAGYLEHSTDYASNYIQLYNSFNGNYSIASAYNIDGTAANFGNWTLAQSDVKNKWKIAVALEDGSQAAAANGTLGVTRSNNLPAGKFNRLYLGNGYANGRTFNGYIKKLSFYDQRLSNAEIVALTENN